MIAVVKIGQCSQVGTDSGVGQRGYWSGVNAVVVGGHVIVDDVDGDGCAYVESLSGHKKLLLDELSSGNEKVERESIDVVASSKF